MDMNIETRGAIARRNNLQRRAHRPDVVKAGMAGGRYRPLTDREIEAIHRTALTILEEIGIGSPTPQIIELITAKGAFLSPLGRLCFPRALIEEVILSLIHI